MSHIDLTSYDLIRMVLGAGGWICAGALIGAIHFMTLRWNASAIADGRSVMLSFGIQLVRLGVTGILLFGIVRIFGALPLLVATVGILVARAVVLRWGALP